MKIFLATSTRADFGLLKNLIYEFKKSDYFDLKIIVTGTHFSKKHGFSFSEIKNEKISVYKKIFITNNTSAPKNILNDMSIISKSISSFIKKDKPDLFVVLGDRYEVLAISLAAYLAKVPIAHIHGGELTQGSLDDGFRHCISKMSYLHFVSHKIYKKRLMQLGERPKNIYNVGALGVENIFKTNFLSKRDLQKSLRINLKEDILLVCLQPEITENLTKDLVNETLAALKNFNDKSIIFTMPGADLYNEIVFKKIRIFVKNNPNSFLFKTLGSQKFLSFLKSANVIIGNSSSGFLEVPSLKRATINIGQRQTGRESSETVINCMCISNEISNSIELIYTAEFRKKLAKGINPYEKGNTAGEIYKILSKTNPSDLQIKKFHDLSLPNEG
jgi:GDP/UDP-N,N'-diacetylbacillosamine 2-epimerase (hydrolysing)